MYFLVVKHNYLVLPNTSLHKVMLECQLFKPRQTNKVVIFYLSKNKIHIVIIQTPITEARNAGSTMLSEMIKAS